MSVPVHPICSGGEPDSNGGVAQGLRDTLACSLQPPGRVTAEAESGERGMQQSDERKSEDKHCQTDSNANYQRLSSHSACFSVYL